LRRDDIEPLRRLLADDMHRRPAARAGRILGRDHHLDAGQMKRQRRTRLGAPFRARRFQRRILLLRFGLAPRQRLLDVLKGELQLVGIELLRAPAELGTLQLAQQMVQPLVPLERAVALGTGGVALGHGPVALAHRAADQGAQRFDVIGKEVGGLAHTKHRITIGTPCRNRFAPRVNLPHLLS
jgi:hypothetical protein